MPICKECNVEIDELQVLILEENKYAISIHKDEVRWSSSEVIEGTEKHVVFGCPLCDEELFAGDYCDTRDKAVDFLRGDPENVPCEKCGNKDLPLHYNRLCPDCFVVPDKEAS